MIDCDIQRVSGVLLVLRGARLINLLVCGVG
jgi:hypothetical protein